MNQTSELTRQGQAAATGNDVRTRLSALAGTARPTAGLLAKFESSMATIGSVMIPLGIVTILLGWYGTSNSSYPFEQYPYLISGGLLGFALVSGGAAMLFASWVGRSADQAASAHRDVVVALEELGREVRASREAAAAAPVVTTVQKRRRSKAVVAASANGHRHTVATANGSMLHRVDCRIVIDRDGVHAVAADADGYRECKLCQPLSV